MLIVGHYERRRTCKTHVPALVSPLRTTPASSLLLNFLFIECLVRYSEVDVLRLYAPIVKVTQCKGNVFCLL
jgi:hypothetical protein